MLQDISINLEQYHHEGDILNCIITIEETWAKAYEPEFKQQSSKWHHAHSLQKCKA
jgi:hypothetical protein